MQTLCVKHRTEDRPCTSRHVSTPQNRLLSQRKPISSCVTFIITGTKRTQRRRGNRSKEREGVQHLHAKSPGQIAKRWTRTLRSVCVCVRMRASVEEAHGQAHHDRHEDKQSEKESAQVWERQNIFFSFFCYLLQKASCQVQCCLQLHCPALASWGHCNTFPQFASADPSIHCDCELLPATTRPPQQGKKLPPHLPDLC